MVLVLLMVLVAALRKASGKYNINRSILRKWIATRGTCCVGSISSYNSFLALSIISAIFGSYCGSCLAVN